MIARDGWSLILLVFAAAVGAVVSAIAWPSVVLTILSIVLGLITLLMVYFFRDPERTTDLAPGIILSPADGKVVAIKTDLSHAFVGNHATQVSIFLSVLDVHVNRVPASGTVSFVSYIAGKFMAAFADKASTDNEQTEIGMITDVGQPLAFKQIAGLIARRIVCRLEPGNDVQAGRRMGIIKFGSRVDIILPQKTDIRVRKGERVVGGLTVIGYLDRSKRSTSTMHYKAEDRA